MDVAALQTSLAEPEPKPAYQFDVFISYATVPDARLVRGLEVFLEGFYRVPLPEGEKPLRPLQVCVDGTDFALRRLPRERVNGIVEDVVEQALDSYLARSRLLLVCCSSGAVRSRYVAHEIEWFLAQNRECDILLAVTEGAAPMATPEEIFPAAIRQSGLHQQLWYDLRGWHRWERRRWQHVRSFDEARVRMAADVSGVELSTVYPPWWRGERKRRLRLAVAALVAGALIIAASSLAVIKMYAAWNARLVAQSKGLAATANALVPTDPELAALLARTAVATRETADADAALREATGASRIRRPIQPADATAVRDVAWSRDGRLLTVAAMADGHDRVEVWDEQGRRDGPPLAHRGVVTAAMFSPDASGILTVGRDQGAQLWRRGETTWERAGDPFAAHDVQSAAFDPSGRRIALGDSNSDIGIWEVDGSRAQQTATIPDSHPAESVAFDRTGEWLAWTDNGSVFVWSPTTEKRLLFTSDALVNSLEFAPDGHLLVATGHSVQVWRPTADHPDAPLFRSGGVVRAARVRPQGDLVAVALDDGSIPIVSLAGGAEVITLRARGARVNQAAFSPDGQSLLTASDDGTARIWSVVPKSIQVIDHQRSAAGAAFNVDGSRLVTADTAAYRARIWDPRSGLVRDVQTTFGGPTAVAFGPLPTQACTLVIGSGDYTAQVWDIYTGTAGPLLAQLGAEPSLVAVDPTGTYVLIAASAELQVVGLASRQSIVPRRQLDGHLLGAGFTADGGSVVAVTDHSAQLIALGAGAPPRAFATDLAEITAAALSADGTVLALAGGSSVQRFDAASGNQLSTHGTASAVRRLAVDRTGARVAVALDDEVLLLDRAQVRSLSHKRVTAAAFAPQDDLLVTAGQAGTVNAWSAADGSPIAEVQRWASGSDDRERIEQLLFSPDGSFLVARSGGPTVRVYGRESFRPLPEVQVLLSQRVTRDLTGDERDIYLQAVGRWWWP